MGRYKYGSHGCFSVMFNSLLTCKGLLKIDGKGRGSSINQDYLNNSLQRLLHPPEGVTGTGQVRLHCSLYKCCSKSALLSVLIHHKFLILFGCSPVFFAKRRGSFLIVESRSCFPNSHIQHFTVADQLLQSSMVHLQ